jgi:hypothetical protein
MYEYSNPSVNNSGCSYSSLNKTYSNGGMNNIASGNVPNMANYVVPKLCYSSNWNPNSPSYPPSYDTLQHGQSNTCGGKFTMASAYPYSTCFTCQGQNDPALTPNYSAAGQFVSRACNHGIESSVCNQVQESYRR